GSAPARLSAEGRWWTAGSPGIRDTANPAASAGAPDAVFTERDGPDGAHRVIPRSAWSFVAPQEAGTAPTEIRLADGFKPGLIYELTYVARDPIVVATRMAGVPDLLPPPRANPPAGGAAPPPPPRLPPPPPP